MTKYFLLALPLALGLGLPLACGGNAVADESNCAGYCEDPSANSGKEGLCKDFCTDRSASTEGKEDACTTFCAEQAKCAAVTDCQETCTNTDAISRGGQEVLSKCIADLGCDAGGTGEIGICVIAGLAKLPVSENASSFCEETTVELADTCGQMPSSSSQCLTTAVLLSDKFLSDLNECGSKKDCQSARACTGLAVLANVDLAMLQDPSFQSLLGPILGPIGSGMPPQDGMGGTAN